MSEIELRVNIENPENANYDIKISNIKFQKMLFLFNAINDGWSIKKRNDCYIVKKIKCFSIYKIIASIFCNH